jgi:flagellar biosynthesis/type III secretory pathway chaperone
MADVMNKLIQTLNEELQMQRDLETVLEQKLDAMQRRDLDRMDLLFTQEQKLVNRLRLNNQKRTVAVRQAVKQFLPDQPSEAVSARELARILDEPEQGKLLTLVALLKEVAEKIQRLNRIVAQATRKLMGHFDAIFNMIAHCGDEMGLYGRQGKKEIGPPRQLVDAIA